MEPPIKKSYSLSEIQSRCTCRYFMNTRCVTTELMHIMSQYHRCVTLRNATVFLFINIILKILYPFSVHVVTFHFYYQPYALI